MRMLFFRYIFHLFFSILVLCLVAPDVYARENAPSRPRIGIVLSGGGARGMAHIGVLKVLEELKIPIDCIAGTSMGAIVGGLYALGYSPEELERIVKDINWDEVFIDKPPREDLPYRYKQDSYTLKLGFDLNEGFALPKGLIAGRKLDFILRSLVVRRWKGEDFDNLRIPFRPVATDIETGSMVVLDRGDLAKAIRASMAVPGVFSPVEIDGKLLIDGGVARNLPVDVVKQMGVDVVIAVNIGSPLMKREGLKNFIGISSQLSRLLTNGNIEEQIALLQKEDVLVVPDLGDIRASDFTRGIETIAIGEQAAREASQDLMRYSVDQAQYDEFLRKQRLEKTGSEPIDFIEVKETSRMPSEVIQKRLEKAMGSTLNWDILGYQISELYELGEIETIDFTLSQRDEKQWLLLNIREKTWRPRYLSMGLTFSGDLEGESSFNVLVGYKRTWVNRLGGEWKAELRFGEEQRFFTEFYQPLDPYAWAIFLSPSFEYNDYPLCLFEGKERIAEYRMKSMHGGFDIGLQLGRFEELRTGIIRGNTDANLHIGETTLPGYEVDQGGYRVQFVIDRLDNIDFPTQGGTARVRFFAMRDELGAASTYEKIDARAVKPVAFGEHTLLVIGRYGSGFGHELPLCDKFSLGGFMNLSGLHADQFLGSYLLIGQMVYYAKTKDLIPVKGRGSIYVGASIEAGNVWEKRSEIGEDLQYAGSIFVAARTGLGPLYLGYGHAEGDNNAIYLMLGHPF